MSEKTTTVRINSHVNTILDEYAKQTGLNKGDIASLAILKFIKPSEEAP